MILKLSSAQLLLASYSLLLLSNPDVRVCLVNRPVLHGVCHLCFAAAPGAPGAAAWLSLAGAAGLCSYWHLPSAGNGNHIVSTINHSHFVNLTTGH